MTTPTSPPKPTSTDRRTLLLGLLLMGAIAFALVALLALRSGTTAAVSTPRPTNTPNVGAGETITLIDPGREVRSFRLPSSAGGELALEDLRGKAVLLYFGYTHCPDFCPTTLAQFAAVHERLGEQAQQVQALLISVDPARDTPEVLAEYVSRFDQSFIGLQGSAEVLASIGPDYGLNAIVPEDGATPAPDGAHAGHSSAAGEDSGYLVDHTVSSYLLDAQGRLRAIFSYGTPTDEILQAVRVVLGVPGAG